jgi:ATP-dependent DNA helicase PIF1
MNKLFGRVPEQYREAWGLIREGRNVLVQGKAGTGKSTFIKYLKKYLPGNVAFVAPTGLAALHIGGQTIHSFAKLPLKVLKRRDAREMKHRGLYRNLNTLIIDEVSMVRADMFDALDEFLRKNGPRSELPFGGIQIVMVGDLYQLPPVEKYEGGEAAYLASAYETPYFFSAPVYQRMDVALVEFERVFRQQDEEFVEFLDKVREGIVTEDELVEFNIDHVVRGEVSDGVVTLATTNRIVSEINARKLAELPGRVEEFVGRVVGVFAPSEMPTERVLHLKRNAQVVFVRNDEQGRWVNGSVGKVVYLSRGRIEVRVNGKRHEIKPVVWQKVRYVYLPEINQITEEIDGEFWQYPIRLAWALTIHKSQGQTFDRVAIDLGMGAFDTGQVYVALSRVRSSEGIILKKPLKRVDVRVDERVVKFLQK